MSVGGAEPALDPIALDCCLELRNASVEGFVLFCGYGGVGGTGAAAAATVVLSSNGGRADLISARIFLTSLYWLLAYRARW